MSVMPNPVFGIVAVLLLILEIIRLFSGNFYGIDIIWCAIVLGVVYKITAQKQTKRSGDSGPQSSASPEMPVAEVAKIKIPSSVSAGTSENYAVIESILVQAGFTNVKAIPLQNLTIGVMKKPGTVESITVGGKSLSSYVRRRFSADVPIIISYNSLR